MIAEEYSSAQVVVICQICETGIPEQVCHECDYKLCNICSEHHKTNFPKHTILKRDTPVRRQILSIHSKQDENYNVCAEVEKSINVGFTVKYIVPKNPSMIWIAGQYDDAISLYSRNGLREKIICVGFTISGFDITPSNDLVFADFEGNRIIIGFRCGQNEITVPVIGPRGIYCTSKQDILSTQWNKETGEGMVVRYSMKGEERKVIKLDEHGKRLYQCPAKVVENGNSDICVVDTIARKIIVVNEDGKLRFTYDGNTAFQRQNKFYPGDICTDHYHEILVTDTLNNFVDILDCAGQLKVLISTESLSVKGPLSLAVDQKEKLWMSFLKGKIVNVRYYLDYQNAE